MINELAKKLVDAIKQVDKSSTTGYDTAATVKRVEGDTAWVHIDGGVDETPVKMTISASEGDKVQVRVNGGRAWLQGNATAPPTDDTTAISAEKLAESARQAADTASNSAQRAVEDAGRAYAAANSAEQSATAASQAAATADAKAVAAGNAASAAATAAATADSKAEAASQSASAAASAASAASTAAATADAKAEAAGQAATTANNAANNALTQLATVEDVVDVLNWISEHGTYKASTDTEVVAGKYYFTRSGAGTAADPYVYTVVANPTGNPSTQNYYELDSVDEAVSNYISTHLALTDDGLYLIKDGSGYKLRLTNNGMYIVAPNATVVNQTTADGNIIRATDGTIIAHLGYGEGSTTSGTSTSPYYTLGTRRTTSTEYDPSSTYDVGDMCVYNNKIYVCSYAIETPQAWNSSNWTYYIGNTSFASGNEAIASGWYAHAEGQRTKAMGPWSHAEGGGSDPGAEGTLATGSGAHSEGVGTKATKNAAHSEGWGTTASGRGSHTEGWETTASGEYSHAEGKNTTASNDCSHAEGFHTTASGMYSHAEGWHTTASGVYSHAGGVGTTADRPYQTAIGQYNTTGNVNNLFVVGNGSQSDPADPTVATRSDAFTVDSSGNTYAAGNMNIAQGKQYKINGTALAASDVGAVPTTRTVNSKALSSDISLTASDVGAVPTTRTVNNKALSANITLTASDVGALSSSTTYVSGVKGNSESTYRTGQVNITAANVGAVALSDKYTRSSAGDLAWTGSTDGDAKVIAKSALAFWSGAYSGTSSNLSRCSTGAIIGSNGGTMTGQLLTSFKSAVAMGSYGTAQTTVDGFVGEVRYSSGCMGSVSINTAYTKNGTTIPTGWYNFIYSPHRSGGNSGAASGDNCNYGTLILSGMTMSAGPYFIQVNGGAIQSVKLISSTGGWILAGSATGTNTVTISDSNASEVYVKVNPSGSAVYSATILRADLQSVWYVGGYYYSASDYGIINLNVSNSNKTFQLRNVRQGGSDVKASSTLTVYYR